MKFYDKINFDLEVIDTLLKSSNMIVIHRWMNDEENSWENIHLVSQVSDGKIAITTLPVGETTVVGNINYLKMIQKNATVYSVRGMRGLMQVLVLHETWGSIFDSEKRITDSDAVAFAARAAGVLETPVQIKDYKISLSPEHKKVPDYKVWVETSDPDYVKAGLDRRAWYTSDIASTITR